ncbi:ParB/RepB/Spo0J family partition protein [Pseudonocardia spinosispora]|uniref:ParB/RepB/Spo0J family partition protein n=1 Tax=Pseudonocardia spinosispora TaxID=103441 RepID=UPI000A0139AD|nr:ParB/RepB/Spo0J family partition protein [Pseudonocardia spinosispora]
MNDTTRGLLFNESALEKHLLFQYDQIQRSRVSRVPIASLVTSGSPRLAGADAEHVRALAESGAVLPPIVAHLPSRKVVDGVHRMQAAMMRGQTEISVRFFHGSESDVFLLSVMANSQHGLPLSQGDRLAAAEHIFTSHPEWSDRMVAIVVGLSGRKIAALRTKVADHVPQPTSRIGRDGRSRPVDASAGRARAAELVASRPGISLRQVAREAGIAPATAADVRDRLRRGEDPVPMRGTQSKKPAVTRRVDVSVSSPREPLSNRSISELTPSFDQLCKDPSLRFTEAGRTLLRMFDSCQALVRAEEGIARRLPVHSLESVAELSIAYAEVLRSFAAELRQLRSSYSVDDHDRVRGIPAPGDSLESRSRRNAG